MMAFLSVLSETGMEEQKSTLTAKKFQETGWFKSP